MCSYFFFQVVDVLSVLRFFNVLFVKIKWSYIGFYVFLFDLENFVELLLFIFLSDVDFFGLFYGGDILRRVKSIVEKKILIIRRNKVSCSFFQIEVQVKFSGDSLVFGDSISKFLEENNGIKRQKKMKSFKKAYFKLFRKVDVSFIIDMAKLFLFCILLWGVDKDLDSFCIRYFSILKLQGFVFLGFVSNEDFFFLMLFGWDVCSIEMKEYLGVNLCFRKVLDLLSKYIVIFLYQIGIFRGLESYCDFVQ